MNVTESSLPLASLPNVILIGTGVVGRAILQAHVAADVSVCIADLNHDSLHEAVAMLRLPSAQWRTEFTSVDGLNVAALHRLDARADSDSTIVIESIAERLEVKQAFFRDAERIFGDDAILCSNTSTLRIGSIGDDLKLPQRVAGMHFFMPVDQRPAVEVVRTAQTSTDTIRACEAHVRRIRKSPLIVPDSPGFIVNRLLSPYLNQSLLLLAHGVDHQQIKDAALKFGMPMSPLELIDFIGTRTMFDAGRAFWQAFPSRIDPSPIVPALVKAKRLGRSVGSGVYDYDDGQRSVVLPAKTQELCDRYHVESIDVTDEDVVHLLAIPMWIESGLALKAGVAQSSEHIQLAMQGGLGYEHPQGWNGFFNSLGDELIQQAIANWSSRFKSMQA